MIQIILQILSIIGIVILVLLGLLLLAVLLVLFVPVRYTVRAEKEENITLSLKLHWLLHILTVRFDYPESGAVRIKVAGITVYDSKKPPKPKKQKKQKKQKKRKKIDEVAKEEPTPSDTEETADAKTAPDSGTQTGTESGTQAFTESRTQSATEPLPEAKKKKKSLLRKIIDFFRKLKYTITHFYDTIMKVKENIEYYLGVLRDEQTVLLLKNGQTRLLKILKKFRPKKLEADILFGTGEPDITGYVLGLYGMLIPYLGNHVNVTPDFETAVLKGRIFAKGRIRTITIIINALHILLDSNLKPVIQKFKREA